MSILATTSETSARLGRAAVILGRNKDPSALYSIFHKNEEVLTYQRIMNRYEGEEAFQVMGEQLSARLCPEKMAPEELYALMEMHLDG